MNNTETRRVTASLPECVRSFAWIRNHHYVVLEDQEGNTTKLDATALLLGTCVECEEKVVALTNSGAMMCTHCGGCVKWAWSKPQLAFIPEHESKFMGWAEHKNKKEP